MVLNPFICLFLMSCFSSDKPITDFENCPDYCQCYPAPEGGDGLDTAITAVCDWSTKIPFETDRYGLLSSEQINSFVIENIDNVDGLPGTILSDLSITNLVFRKCTMFTNDRIRRPFSGLNKNSLKVLTFIDTIFIEDPAIDGPFNWETLSGLDKVKLIHFEHGQLKTVGSQFKSILSVQSVISLTFESIGLTTIEPGSFTKLSKLRVLKITGNPIETVDWLLDFDSPLWYLDLRENQIKSFPLKVAQKLSRLRNLYLGGNNIHVLSYQVSEILMNQLAEFSFSKIEGSGNQKKEFFYPTKDMKWVKDIATTPGNVFTRYPRFLCESVKNYHCIENWSQVGTKVCAVLNDRQFNYPESATTEELGIYSGHLSYRNKKFMFSGVELPFNWKENELEQWLNKMKVTKENTVKIHLNMDEWFVVPNRGEVSFNQMIDSLENDLELCESKGIFVIISLWSSHSPSLPTEFLNEPFITNYYEKHLEPLVKRLSKKKSLAAWDLFDIPENIIKTMVDEVDKCLDTMDIIQPQPNRRFDVDVTKIQSFLGKQAQIIHNIEPRKLVTATISETNAFNPNLNKFNHFEDECMTKAMGGTQYCPDNDCALDYYTVMINTDGSGIRSLKSSDLSSKSPKPIVIIVNDLINLRTIISKWDTREWDWEIQGILATFNTRIDNPLNDEIITEINYYTRAYEPLILQPEYDN